MCPEVKKCQMFAALSNQIVKKVKTEEKTTTEPVAQQQQSFDFSNIDLLQLETIGDKVLAAILTQTEKELELQQTQQNKQTQQTNNKTKENTTQLYSSPN